LKKKKSGLFLVVFAINGYMNPLLSFPLFLLLLN